MSAAETPTRAQIGALQKAANALMSWALVYGANPSSTNEVKLDAAKQAMDDALAALPAEDTASDLQPCRCGCGELVAAKDGHYTDACYQRLYPHLRSAALTAEHEARARDAEDDPGLLDAARQVVRNARHHERCPRITEDSCCKCGLDELTNRVAARAATRGETP